MRPFFTFLKQKFGSEPIIGVEVGVKEGNNAAEIIQNLNIKKLFLVDPWKPFDCLSTDTILRQKYLTEKYHKFCYNKVKTRFQYLGNRIEIIREISVEASKRMAGLFDFVYIDALHSYSSVARDCKAWFSKIKETGFLGGHDYCNTVFPGVRKAVDEFAAKTNKKVQPGPGSVDWWLI